MLCDLVLLPLLPLSLEVELLVLLLNCVVLTELNQTISSTLGTSLDLLGLLVHLLVLLGSCIVVQYPYPLTSSTVRVYTIILILIVPLHAHVFEFGTPSALCSQIIFQDKCCSQCYPMLFQHCVYSNIEAG